MKSTIELLDRLPDLIKKPNKNPIDEWDNEIYYHFHLLKDEGVYELSYYSFLMDSELISFSGSLDEVVKNMTEYINNLEE